MLGPGWCRVRGTGATGRSVAVEKVGEVGGGLVMEGFEREEKFELNPLCDREPVELF